MFAAPRAQPIPKKIPGKQPIKPWLKNHLAVSLNDCKLPYLYYFKE